MYKIACIDEEESQRRRFERGLYKDFQVITFAPDPDLEKMVETLLENHFNAIITDFNLKEKDPKVTYDGVDLVNAIQDMRRNFPCFVLSSFDQNAADKAEDVNLIYIKKVLEDKESKLSFSERVKLQIDKYVSKIKEAENEFNALVEKKGKEGLSAVEEDRLIELDSFLEASIFKRSAFPADLKRSTVNDHFQDLIRSTEALLERLGGGR